jgi:hypothetical protein
MKSMFWVMAVAITAFSSCKKEGSDTNSQSTEPVVIKGSGNIQDKIDAFRHLLGDQLNTTPGATGGRREVNWDGVPDSMVGKALPFDFFNPTGAGAPAARQRGLAYAATGEFRVSNASFVEVNNQASTQFSAFSGNKTFANISSNLWEVDFQVAGETTAASAKGFGAVFSDVDLANSTSLEFFNGQKSLGKFFAPAHDATTGFSFLGVYFKNNEVISRVRVSHDGMLNEGQKDISDGGSHDLVVFDDFLYSEPVQK